MASTTERTLYRITYKLITGPIYFGQWGEEDLPYPTDGGPNGWVLSGVETASVVGGVLVLAHWCRVDPREVTT